MEPSGEPDLTKEAYHPFDSQDELDQEVENEKISHINRGFDVSGYSTSHSGRSGSRARSSALLTATLALSFRPEVSASAPEPDLPAKGAFSVPLSQRATLRPHRRKKGSELV